MITESSASRNEILTRSYDFAVRIVKLCRQLERDKVGRVLTRQILCSGTSIGANVEEAQAAQSRKDFAHKLSIARKEARECHYWLRLLREAELFTQDRLAAITDECEQILKMLTTIIKSTQTKPAATRERVHNEDRQ